MSSVKADMRFLGADEESGSIVLSNSQSPKFQGIYVLEAVTIHDGRQDRVKATLDKQGFQLIKTESEFKDFRDKEKVEKEFYPEVDKVIKQYTGASEVLIFDHTIREDGSKSGRFPAMHVHADYTEESAPVRVRQLIEDPIRAEEVLKKDFLEVNFWRSINGTVKRSPLAFLEALSVEPKQLVPVKVTNSSYDHDQRKREIYGVKNCPGKQRWVYFPHMNENEAVLFKGFDSRGNLARFTPHSAFEHPQTRSDDPPRVSIELRAFAFFD